MYLAELRAAGKDPAQARVMGGDLWLIVAEDPGSDFRNLRAPPDLLV
jgi:hypothetical protein